MARIIKSKSNRIVPDFTEDFVSFMVQMILTITRFPRAPFALVPLSKQDERIYGADVKIESIAPLYIQFKRSFAYPEHSTASFLTDRRKLKLSNQNRVLYFELRDKQKGHTDFQHNILLDLRQRLNKGGTGNAVYAAPLFLNRTAYLLAVHTSSIIHWRPWHLFFDHPFFERNQNIVTHTGSIRFQNCPVLREHIAIPPHTKVTTSKHKYSYLETGQQVCFHSPSILDDQITLGQFIYDFMRFDNGQPARRMTNIFESANLLNELSNACFGESYPSQTDALNLPSIIDQWLDFGEKLKIIYDIDQYMLLKFRNE